MPRTVAMFLLCFAALVATSAGAEQQRPYSIDDLLKLETVGAARIDPTGHWLVYERAPRYDQLPDYSVGRIGTWNSTGGRLMIVDLTAAQPSPQLLFKPDPKKMYWIDSFSPDGQSLAFYAAEGPHVTEGVYQIRNKRLVSFDAAPRIDWVTGHTSVWLSATKLLYDATAEGDEPSSLSFRGYTGNSLTAAWNKSWRGKEPSFGVVESHADGGGHDFLPGRLIEADVKSGQMRILGRGQFDDLKLSPDGRYLAALKQAEKIQPEPNRVSSDWISARSVLVLFDLAKGAEVAGVAPGLEVFPGTLEWAEDADRLALFAWKSGAGVRSGIFYGFDAARRVLTAYPHIGLDLASERERGWSQRPERVVWIGNRLAVVARATHAGAPPQFTYRDITGRGPVTPPKADWFLLDADGHSENLTANFKNISAVPVSATATQLFLLADGNVWRVGPGEPAVNLTAKVGLPLRFSGPSWGSPDEPPFQSSATLESTKDGKTEFVMINLKSGLLVQVPSPSLYAQLMATSSPAEAVMFRETSENGSSLLLSRAGKTTVTLDRYNTFLKHVAKDKWITIHYSSVGGHDVLSCLLLPPGYKQGTRYPAIVEVYPGRTAGCVKPGYSDYFVMGARPTSYSMHLLAAKGYVVLEATAPSGLIQTASGPLARLPEVVVDGANALVQQGYADPDRIGLLGYSQGGFSSLWVTTQTNRFKATVSMNGWSDLFSHYFEGASQSYGLFYASEFPFGNENARYEATTGTDFPIGHTPWENPMIYIRNSPVFEAPDVHTPILMIHSDMDGFGLGQYDEMFAALYRMRKEAKYIRFWGEGHSPSSPANIRYMWQQIFQWYGKYLGKGETR